jgi:hypothetical protein
MEEVRLHARLQQYVGLPQAPRVVFVQVSVSGSSVSFEGWSAWLDDLVRSLKAEMIMVVQSGFGVNALTQFTPLRRGVEMVHYPDFAMLLDGQNFPTAQLPSPKRELRN